ncbi:lung seven transmembrane receptor-domain-containing protein [Amanita rubescens]|nr:lung seven transmembrane receptor-domain-containing protein [Amanita rubescens]
MLGRLVLLGFLACLTLAYEAPIVDTDYSRQICSGMWSGTSTYINVTFEPESQGQVAMVIYEWADSGYLGKVIDPNADYLPKTYVCTTSVMAAGHCTQAQLGQFIIDLPEGKSISNTSFWSARVVLPDKSVESNTTAVDLQHNAAGSPTSPPSERASPWRRGLSSTPDRTLSRRQSSNISPQSPHHYTESIHYIVERRYPRPAVVPVTLQSPTVRRDALHATYKGTVMFRNAFDGKLPATDYPKVNFYFMMFLFYAVLACLWGWLCYKHVHELLPIQYYLSGLVGLVLIEMVANWAYYRYLNAHGKSTASTVFLIVVAVLDAGRNSMSFFMLLVVSLGLSVVRETLGRTMIRCKVLAAAHFVFGILYSIGIVELEIRSTSGIILLLFIVPLAFTLSGFLLWIMYALNATIAQLQSRKQHYKLSKFTKLHRILLLVVVVIIAFFVVSSFVFSGRLAEDYAARSWKVQWWLLDGWMALLYLAAFSAILYLWRPSVGNGR